jgi:hypothetical protein
MHALFMSGRGPDLALHLIAQIEERPALLSYALEGMSCERNVCLFNIRDYGWNWVFQRVSEEKILKVNSNYHTQITEILT